ncbi:MAG: hypothetical protein Q8Q02_07095 [Nocardioides sp.]|nr:hypothetical protein [Nocardioides sp.]
MFTKTQWSTGMKPAFGMSAPTCVQGSVGGFAATGRVRHIDALATGATPGTPAWSPPDW